MKIYHFHLNPITRVLMILRMRSKCCGARMWTFTFGKPRICSKCGKR